MVSKFNVVLAHFVFTFLLLFLSLFLEPVSCLDSTAGSDITWPQGVTQCPLLGISAFAMSLAQDYLEKGYSANRLYRV